MDLQPPRSNFARFLPSRIGALATPFRSSIKTRFFQEKQTPRCARGDRRIPDFRGGIVVPSEARNLLFHERGLSGSFC